MSRIKSAWEIALEKTQDIEFNEEKYLRENLVKEGKSLMGMYINNPEMEISEVKKKLSTSKNKNLLKEGMVYTIVSNIVLPQDEGYKFRFNRIKEISVMLNTDSEDIFNQMESFFDEYLNSRDSFIQNMEEQIKQAMQSNPQSINSEQYSEIINQNLKKLTSQYSGSLDELKQELIGILG